MADTKNQNSNSGDGLSLIVGGLFVLALVFATYSYFNKSNEENIVDVKGTATNEELAKTDETLTEKLKELFGEQNGQEEGDLNGMGAKTERVDNVGTGTDVDNKQDVYTHTGGSSSTWVAKDYKHGDISGNSYIVKAGDTLWEIAEAKYGSGFDWNQILEANKDNVGYLANGEQALIVVGQSLILP